MASCFVEADEEFIEEQRNTRKNMLSELTLTGQPKGNVVFIFINQFQVLVRSFKRKYGFS